ncbi:MULTISPECIES: hypothetical protein [unclassified Saccharibacter]|uniref:hypothetical protein n=1 Tax=unclassified Saccharibacter TaxID=2648722 RepID=UPI00132632D3|nr:MULTISPECIES: hypothetical protein [unclassified Saccharibacter]MXV35795.1 hypothetical protein [Saccharibacter sp. EH611]MXV57916.1 hypothetical protein [Saccharibacter sp. EH70]MXV66311.1 hypothetical protein [Saccharibacter sp. EH60]
MRRRLIWTDELRGKVVTLKQAGFSHQDVADRLGLTLCQVYWGWKLYRENAPSRRGPVFVDDSFIRRVSELRQAGFYRREIAQKLHVPVSRIDLAIVLGRKHGIDMAINARIYSKRQAERNRKGV